MQRRRDRINEKMRALQELIPNCNKVYFIFFTVAHGAEKLYNIIECLLLLRIF